jgi:hypothetical protein
MPDASGEPGGVFPVTGEATSERLASGSTFNCKDLQVRDGNVTAS